MENRNKTAKSKITKGPPKSGAFQSRRNNTQTEFIRFYKRGDLPILVERNDIRLGVKLKWRVEIEKLDYHHYLPIFFDGLRETTEPYATIAERAVYDMLVHCPEKTLSCVAQLIIPLKNALATKEKHTVCKTLKVIQTLVLSGDNIGKALVPYYRQLLPVCNVFKNKNLNTGDAIDYGQRQNMNIGDLIDETLECLEKTGGPDAYINIKYMIPVYESCMNNR